MRSGGAGEKREDGLVWTGEGVDDLPVQSGHQRGSVAQREAQKERRRKEGRRTCSTFKYPMNGVPPVSFSFSQLGARVTGM